MDFEKEKKNIIVKNVIEDYDFNISKGTNKLTVKQKEDFTNFVNYLIEYFDDFKGILEDCYEDEINALKEEYEEECCGQSIEELENEQYIENVLEPQTKKINRMNGR